jgi:hypothetical protein
MMSYLSCRVQAERIQGFAVRRLGADVHRLAVQERALSFDRREHLISPRFIDNSAFYNTCKPTE